MKVVERRWINFPWILSKTVEERRGNILMPSFSGTLSLRTDKSSGTLSLTKFVNCRVGSKLLSIWIGNVSLYRANLFQQVSSSPSIYMDRWVTYTSNSSSKLLLEI
jgi:hypothetical protein